MSEILIFIHSQGLLNGVQRRVLTYEFLQNNDDAVSSAIANYDGGARSLEDVIRRAGNIEWDANLRRLLNQGLITPDTFINASMNKNDDDCNDLEVESKISHHFTLISRISLFPIPTLRDRRNEPEELRNFQIRQAVSLRQNTTHPNK